MATNLAALTANSSFDDWTVLDIPTARVSADFGCTPAFKLGIFPVDLDAFETLCNAATGCSFDKTWYTGYAWGIKMDEGVTPCVAPA